MAVNCCGLMIGRLAVNWVFRKVLRESSATPAGIQESDLTPNGKRCRMCAPPLAPLHYTVRRLHRAGPTSPFLSPCLREMHTKRKTVQNAPTESLYAIRTGRVCATKVATKGRTPATENRKHPLFPVESTYFGLKNSPHARARER